MGNSFEKRDFKWDWLNDSDAPQEDKDDYAALESEPDSDSDYETGADADYDSGNNAAGCIFGSAMIALCLILAYLLTKIGGMW